MKQLILVRGCSGSGKSTFAESIQEICILGGKRCIIASADQYFEENGYKFDHTKLGIAHERCQEKVDSAMYFKVDLIFVTNTFTSEDELAPYIKLAAKNNYHLTSIIMENRHNKKDIHDVPWVTLNNQEKRLRSSMKLLPVYVPPGDKNVEGI